MLEINTNNGNLILDSKTKIRFSYLFPLFVTDAIPNTVTYSFDLPDDPEGINASYLRAARFFDSARKYRKLLVTIIFNGDEFDSGILICTGYSNHRFRCTFLSTIFADNFAEIEMQNVPELMIPITLGNTTSEIVAKAKELSEKQYPDSNVCFPMIYAPDFYGDANTDFAGILNNYQNDGYVINEITKPWETGDPEEGDYETNENSLLPCFYVREIIRQIFISQGFFVKGNFFSSPFTKNIIMLATKAADRVDDDYCFDGEVTTYYNRSGQIILKCTNYDIKSGFSFNSTTGEVLTSGKGYYDVVGENLTFQYVSGARILYIDILYKILDQTYFNVKQLTIASNNDVVDVESIIGSFYRDDTQQIAIYICCNQNYIPISGSISIRGTSQNTLNRFAKSISIGDSFNGTTIASMVNAIRSLFGLLFFVDKKRQVVEVELAANIIENSTFYDITSMVISAPEKDWEDRKKYTVKYNWADEKLMTPLVNPTGVIELPNAISLPKCRMNTILKIATLYRYLVPSKQDDGTCVWKEDVTFINHKATAGLANEDYTIDMQSLVSHHAGNGIIVPYFPGEGRSDVFGNQNEMRLTVLTYFGFSNKDYNNNAYPTASIGNLNSAGIKQPNYQNLRIDDNDPDNIYERAIKPMLDLVGNHETITVDIQPNYDNIKRILSIFRPSTENEKHPPRKVILDGAEMFVKQFDFEVTTNGIAAAQLKLAKNNYEY